MKNNSQPTHPTTTWRCTCGKGVLWHWEYCPTCVAVKPKEEKAK